MESATMGKVLVTAKIENLDDLVLANKSLLPADQVRSVEVTEALVDTGAGTLSLPKGMIAQLGLQPLCPRQARTSAGIVTLNMFRAVRLAIQGRDCICDVIEIPDDCPVLIGQIPLEALDFVIDPKEQKLIGNPRHGGEYVIELY